MASVSPSDTEPAFVSVSSSTQPTPEVLPVATPVEPAGVASTVVDMFQRSSHPKAAVFHVVFKVAALVCYFLSGLMGLSAVQLFVVCIVLSAFDFWTVKNVTGRLMVGLRWWNESGVDGTSTWRYESIEDQSTVSAIDYSLFWYSMYLSGSIWALFAFLALIKLDLESVLLCSVCLVLVWSNVYSYWNCSANARNQVTSAVAHGIQQGTVAALTGNWFGTSSSAASKPEQVV